MYNRFTDRARRVMQLAKEAAQRLDNEYIGTEHILRGLVKEEGGAAAEVLKRLRVQRYAISAEIIKCEQRGVSTNLVGRLPQTPRAKKVIEYAMDEARNLDCDYVGTEHILLGLLREDEGFAAQVLMNLGLRLDQAQCQNPLVLLLLVTFTVVHWHSRPSSRRSIFTPRIGSSLSETTLIVAPIAKPC